MEEGISEAVIEATFRTLMEASPTYSFKGSGPKRLLVMSGLPLSGKTYFVNEMNRRKPGKFQQVNSHVIRPVLAKHWGGRDLYMTDRNMSRPSKWRAVCLSRY